MSKSDYYPAYPGNTHNNGLILPAWLVVKLISEHISQISLAERQ